MAIFFMLPPKPPMAATFEVRQDKHGIVIGYAPCPWPLLSGGSLSATGSNLTSSCLIHDIDRAECPAIDLECFAMLCRGIAVAMIKAVLVSTMALFGISACKALRSTCPWDDIWTVFFASMHLDGPPCRKCPDLPGCITWMRFAASMTGEKIHTLAADSLAAFFTTFCEPLTGVWVGEAEMLSSALARRQQN